MLVRLNVQRPIVRRARGHALTLTSSFDAPSGSRCGSGGWQRQRRTYRSGERRVAASMSGIEQLARAELAELLGGHRPRLLAKTRHAGPWTCACRVPKLHTDRERNPPGAISNAVAVKKIGEVAVGSNRALHLHRATWRTRHGGRPSISRATVFAHSVTRGSSRMSVEQTLDAQTKLA